MHPAGDCEDAWAPQLPGRDSAGTGSMATAVVRLSAGLAGRYSLQGADRMIEFRKSSERGHASHDWLSSAHTFSFADYFDRQQMGFGVLRVINEDWVAPGKGFGTHSHHDMEIISYVLEGALEHRDSLGTGSVIQAGDVQRISAGSGVAHSEFNASQTEPVHFLQIWIQPKVHGIRADYAERRFNGALRGRLAAVVSPDGREGSLTINQDAVMYAGRLEGGESAELEVAPGRRAYVHLARGDIELNGQPMSAGDGAKVVGELRLELRYPQKAEVLVFDLP
jgi:redox-sensitive bicupin YhaK (pirin superfamily)